ncbi:uncharacterized protein LOC135258215 isoform X3 [Anguilla rostrata]|uniref:uncharacterized protein LOC135258215 isoform X3 n=1 Tax=Anguilla rostrata TaxID=7938 RepID=UPI0030CE965E
MDWKFFITVDDMGLHLAKRETPLEEKEPASEPAAALTAADPDDNEVFALKFNGKSFGRKDIHRQLLPSFAQCDGRVFLRPASAGCRGRASGRSHRGTVRLTLHDDAQRHTLGAAHCCLIH